MTQLVLPLRQARYSLQSLHTQARLKSSLMLLLMVFCRPLFSIFCADIAVVDIGVYMLTTMMPSYVLFVFIEIFSGALRGVSDVLIPTLITMGGVLLVRVPWILLLMPVYPNILVVIYSYPLSWAITAALFTVYYFYRKRKILLRLQPNA